MMENQEAGVSDQSGCARTALAFLKRTALALAGGVFCAVIWFLMDRYLFVESHAWDYYCAVVFAYAAGTGQLSFWKGVEARTEKLTPQSSLRGSPNRRQP